MKKLRVILSSNCPEGLKLLALIRFLKFRKRKSSKSEAQNLCSNYGCLIDHGSFFCTCPERFVFSGHVTVDAISNVKSVDVSKCTRVCVL